MWEVWTQEQVLEKPAVSRLPVGWSWSALPGGPQKGTPPILVSEGALARRSPAPS